jgi:hypothetical protein
MDLIDFATEGAGILAAQQGRLRVEVTRASFSALSEAIRRRRIMMAPDSLRSQPSYLIGLRAFSAIARDISPSGAVFADHLDPILAGLVREGMESIDEILGMAKRAGFIVHAKTSTKGMNGDDNQYLYVLERIM